MSQYYYYGLAAMIYLTTCWAFSAVRWWHTCREPKSQHQYIWPDRKLQVLVYLCATLTLPYAIDPTDEAAWMLMKSYFPATYYFYFGLLLLCFFGTVKQWERWKTFSWTAAVVVIATMIVPVLNAWLPFRFMSDEGIRFWQTVITVESIVMMGFTALAIWQVWNWMREARDANYSNPDDFPIDYARRVYLMPVVLTVLLWPAYILDSPAVMAVEHVLQAVFNIVLLITVLPSWRRKIIIPDSSADSSADDTADTTDADPNPLIDQTAREIEAYVRDQQAYLDPHLKINDIVAHTHLGRTYVSLTFSQRFGSFANYVNSLRLTHFERYQAEHPAETKETAALASGFSSYTACYRARKKLDSEGYTV